MERWTDPEWLAVARAWIDGELERLGLRVTGEIEQPHVRPWSTVLRIPTDGGDVWFKANMPLLAPEAGVVRLLAQRRPDAVPPLLAVDLDHGWMLMADGGERLREVVVREHDLRRWLDVLPLYAGVQIDMAERADDLVALGLPDRRLAGLASQFDDVLKRLQPLEPDLRAQLGELVPRIADLCEQLAEYDVPETVQHDDLHDGQVFVRDGRYFVFDWGDACVSHPFFSMSVTLEGGLAWGVDDVENSEDIGPYRDIYLEPFTRYATLAELRAAHAVALRLGWVCRALNVERFASALEPPHREEHLRGVGVRLQMLLSGLEESA